VFFATIIFPPAFALQKPEFQVQLLIGLSLSENRTSENEDLQSIGNITMSERTYAFRITCSLAGGVIESVEPTVLLTLPDLPTIEVYLTAKDDQNKLGHYRMV
jgi:hypothetical protein